MATEDEWITISNDSTESSTDDEGWVTIESVSSQIPPKQNPQVQSQSEYLLGRASEGLAGLGAAGAYTAATGPGAIFASDPMVPELVMQPSDIQSTVGIQPAKPEGQGTITRLMGAGLAAGADPLSYVGGIGSIPFQAAQNVATGVSAEAGGEGGNALVRGFTGEESPTGRLIGNVVGGLAGAATQGPIRYGVEAGGDFVSQLNTKYSKVKADPSQVENMVASNAAKRFLEEGAKAGGKDYNKMIEDFREVSQFVIGADAPLMLQAADNPVFREEVVRLAKTDTTKRAALEAEVNRIAAAIDSKAVALFGQKYAPIPPNAPLNIRNVRKRIDQIDTKINELADPFASVAGKTDTGKAVTNLVEAKRTLVKREMAPRYEALKQAARDEGLTIDAKATEALYLYVKQNRVADIFGRQTSPERQVSSILSPKQVEGAASPEFKEMTFDNVDSLKRLVNAELRRVKDPTQVKKLEDFKTVLDDVREQYVPPSYNNALSDLDTEYYQRLGIPFGNQGIKDISAKKYSAQIAPVLLDNKESYRSFIAVAGEEGAEIAKKAMLSRAYDAVIKDGVVNGTSLRTFMKKNEEVLKEMPDVLELMNNTRMSDKQLRASRATLETQYAEAQKRIAQNWFNGTQTEVPSMQQLVNDAFVNPRSRSKLVRDIQDLSPEAADAVRQSMRASVVQKAMDNPKGGVEFLTNKDNKASLDAILGKGYQNNLMKVLQLSDAVKKVDIKKMTLAVDLEKNLDPLNRIFPGLDIQGTIATFRRPIVSATQKGVILYSKISQAKATNVFDDKIFSILTDPNAVKQLAEITDGLDLAFKNPVTLKKALTSIVDSIPARTYIALTAPEEQETRRPTANDEKLLNMYLN
jgi:hypothetical protein